MPLLCCACAAPQIRQEGELRGHADGVTNLAWHPSHPDKLASIAGSEKSVRCAAGAAAAALLLLPLLLRCAVLLLRGAVLLLPLLLLCTALM